MDIWNVAQFFIAPARDGAHAQQNDAILARIGGAFIVVNPRLASHVSQHDTILKSQGVWIHLKHPIIGKLGIANIYMPNSATKRITLWHYLFDTLDATIPWIRIWWKTFRTSVGVIGPYPQAIRVWNHFKHRFNLVDNFALKLGHLNFS